MNIVEEGHEAAMLYIVQREDGNVFSTADHIDPKYGELLREAVSKGVKVLAYQCELSPEGVNVARSIEVKL